jgi:hypothetical protein
VKEDCYGCSNVFFVSMENPNSFEWEGQNLLHNKIGGTSAE